MRLLVLIFFFITGILHGQIRNFSIKDGLPHSNLHGVAVDKNNIVWIASEAGITRFNGVTFKNYSINHGFSNPHIYSLQVDKYNNIWAAGRSGIYVKPFYAENFIFIDYQYHVVELAVDFPFVYSRGFYVGTTIHNLITHEQKTVFPQTRDYRIKSKMGGGIWLLSPDSLFAFDGFDYIHWEIDGLPHNKKFIDLVEDEKHLYILSTNQIFKVAKETHAICGSFSAGMDFQHKYARINLDNQSRILLWDYWDKGQLLRISLQKKGVKVETLLSGVIPGKICTTDKMVLLPSYGQGLFLYPDNKLVSKWEYDNFPDYVNDIYADTSITLLATANGLFLWDSNYLRRIPINTLGAYMPNYIRKIARYKKGFIVAHTPVIQNKVTAHRGKNIYSVFARCFALDGDTIYYPQMSTNDIYKGYYDSDEVYHEISYMRFPMPLPEQNESYVKDILLYKHWLLLATHRGLSLYDKRKPKQCIASWWNQRSFYFIRRVGDMYVLGSSDGLLIGNIQKGFKLKKITQKNNEEYYCFLNPTKNCFLFGTNFGLVIYEKNKVAIIDENEGLDIQQIYTIAQLPKRHSLLVGGTGGLYTINFTNTLFESAQQGPSVEFTQVSPYSQIEIVSSTSSFNLTDSWGSHFFIAYAAVKYYNQNNVWYRYRLNEQEWEYTQSRDIIFHYLKPGNYTLQIAASDNLQEWGSAQALQFVVRPYVWQTEMFKIALAFFALFCMYGIYRWVRKRTAKRIRRHALLSQYKIQSLNASINSHFIYNVLNSIRYYIYTNKNDKAGEMLDYFGTMIRNTVNYSGKIFVPLRIELENLHNYVAVARLRFEAPIQLVVENELDEEMALVPFLLLQPFVENSLQHGYRDDMDPYPIFVKVFRLEEENYIKITIEDFGLSLHKQATKLPTDKDKHSYAISNIRERLDLLYTQQGLMADMRIVNKTLQGQDGFLVELILPMKLPADYRLSAF